VPILLSEPEKDFTGGEFVLTEQRPRMRPRAETGRRACDEGLQAGEIALLSRHHPLLFPDFSLREGGERFLRDSARFVSYGFASHARVLFCHTAAAIVASIWYVW
jgi:hypothetical protein